MSLYEIVSRIDQLIRDCHEIQKELDENILTMPSSERHIRIDKIVDLEFQASKDILKIAQEAK